MPVLADGGVVKTPKYIGAKGTPDASDYILQRLPYGESYCEPFAGMLGVLLRRRPSKFEVVNDLDGKICAWWRAIRDHPEELKERFELTEVGRGVFDQAWETLQNGVDKEGTVNIAWSLAVLLEQAARAYVEDTQPYWLSPKGYDDIKNIPGYNFWNIAPSIPLLHQRLKKVVIDNRDALELLERMGKSPGAVIYCDPPYPSTSDGFKNEGYECTVDFDAMLELLPTLNARVAVSGYEECPWENLGWYKHAETRTSMMSKSYRRECLWTNYKPDGQTTLTL